MGYNPNIALDNLAANGIINYDANSFIYGVPPIEQPLMYGYPGPYGYPQQPNDSFVHHNANKHSPTNRNLLTILLGGLTLLVGLNLKDKILELIPDTEAYKAKKSALKKAAGKVTDEVTEKATEAKGFFSRVGKRIMEAIPWTEASKAKKAAAEAAAKKISIWGHCKKVGKWGVIIGGSAAVLFVGLKILGRIFRRRTQYPQPQQLQQMQQPQQPMSQDTLNLTTPGSQTPQPPEGAYVPQQAAGVPPPQEQQIAQVQTVPAVQQIQTVEPVQIAQPVEQPQSVVEQPQPIVQQSQPPLVQ